MNIPTMRGVGSTTDQAEIVYVMGYNGTGAECAQGDVVTLDEGNTYGRTFVQPETENFNLAYGVLADTVGTAQYTARIVAYGVVQTQCYGVATNFVPGANLIMVNDKSYLAYNSAQLDIGQPRCFTALETNSTVNQRLRYVFVRAL